MTNTALVSELVERWAPRLSPLPWKERLGLLVDIHEQLFEDIGDLRQSAEISPLLVAALIKRWGTPAVVCAEQAQIYANSESQFHRAAASEWFSRGRTGSRMPKQVAEEAGMTASIDRRRGPRVLIDRPATLMSAGRPLGCRILDISTDGAGIELGEPLSIGASIELDVPENGRLEGNVVRAEPPSVGVAFKKPIPADILAAFQ